MRIHKIVSTCQSPSSSVFGIDTPEGQKAAPRVSLKKERITLPHAHSIYIYAPIPPVAVPVTNPEIAQHVHPDQCLRSNAQHAGKRHVQWQRMRRWAQERFERRGRCI